MSANLRSSGPVQLDRQAEPDENVSESDVTDASILARMLARILREIALLKRRWMPRRLDFEDFTVDASGTKKHRFPHHFGGRVRWWPVDWLPNNAGDNFQLERVTGVGGTDKDTLVLYSNVAGVLTLRVEEAGG